MIPNKLNLQQNMDIIEAYGNVVNRLDINHHHIISSSTYTTMRTTTTKPTIAFILTTMMDPPASSLSTLPFDLDSRFCPRWV